MHTTVCLWRSSLYEETWLRRPNQDKVLNIAKDHENLGFPEYIGAVKCAPWEWANCPISREGKYTRKEEKPVCRMEIACDGFLRIWNLMFGVPGSKNDKKIVNMSSFFKRRLEWNLANATSRNCCYGTLSALAVSPRRRNLISLRHTCTLPPRR